MKNLDKVFKSPGFGNGKFYTHNGKMYSALELWHRLLGRYKSPKHETSLMKGIPIEYLETVRFLHSAVKELTPHCSTAQKVLKVRYRGPRAHRPFEQGAFMDNRQSYCLKEDATSFAIYELEA